MPDKANEEMLSLLDSLRTVDARGAIELEEESGSEQLGTADVLRRAVEADYIRKTDSVEVDGRSSYALTQSGRDFVAQHTDGAKEI